MSVQNNLWASWSQNLNAGCQVQQSMIQQASNTSSQIQNLINELNAKTITLAQFQTDVAPLVSSMNGYINNLNAQYSNISGNQAFQQLLSNLNEAWQTTLQSINATGTTLNPNGQGTVPVNTNSDGSQSVTFTSSYQSGGGSGFNRVSYLTGFQSDNPNFPYVPGEMDLSSDNYPFGFSVQHAIEQPGQPVTFQTSTETVTMTLESNGLLSVTITMMPNSSNPNPFNMSSGPSTSALSNFASNPFGSK